MEPISWPLDPGPVRHRQHAGFHVSRIFLATGAVRRSGRLLKPSKVGFCWPAPCRPTGWPSSPNLLDRPTPQQLGAAYQQVVAIQTTTLQSLGDSYREVQTAGAQLASRTAVAIDELNAELSQVKNQHEADAIAAAIRRDRHILTVGGVHAARVEQGLDVARGIADQQANTDKIYIPNGLFTTLTELVRQDRSTGTAISRSGRRSANALVRKLNGLGDQLTSTR